MDKTKGGIRMGLFNFGKKKRDHELPKAPNPVPMSSAVNPPKAVTPIQLNLNKEESLNLLDLRKAEVAATCSSIEALKGMKAQVALVLDYSGSMSQLYNNGTVQSIIERILPIACQFDDNESLDLWIFENGYHRLGSINLTNYYDYVRREILPKYRMRGTNYAPVMKDVIRHYTEKEQTGLPAYVIFITDGDNSDKSETTRVMTEASKKPIFWQFVGIGHESFAYLQRLDDLSGRYTDNADFFKIQDINRVADAKLYADLLNEFPGWITQAKHKGLLK